MKEIFKTRGITLLELLIVISLTGLIFALGITPILTQLRLTRAERAEISLFDDANLAVAYITKDAMLAESANVATANEVTFTITTDATTTPRTKKTTRYHVINQTELERDDSDEGQRVITNRIDGVAVNGNPANLPTFALVTTPNSQKHQLRCTLHLQDPDNANITTRRDFEVMLRCRDAKY